MTQEKMIIVDSHCHLDTLKNKDVDLKEAIKRADRNCVKYLQTICTRLDNFPQILEIAKEYERVFASVGVHPSEVTSDSIPSADMLIDLASHPKVIGLGETGLDYYYHEKNAAAKVQIKSFENHIIAAQILENLPVIVHSREAEEDTAEVMLANLKNKFFPALIHCFSASKGFAKKMIDNEIFISISGIVTFKNALELQDVVRYVPLQYLLVETDSPYLAPNPHRGKTNEPAFTRYVVETIASLKGISTEEVAHQTTENFFNLFGKAYHLD